MAMKMPKLPKPVFVIVHEGVHPFGHVQVLHEPPLGSQPVGVNPEQVLFGLLGSRTVGMPEQLDEQLVFTLNLPPREPPPGLRKITVVCDETVPTTIPLSFLMGCLTTSFASTFSAWSRSFFSCSWVISLSSSALEGLIEGVFDSHPINNTGMIAITSFDRLQHITYLLWLANALVRRLVHPCIRLRDRHPTCGGHPPRRWADGERMRASGPIDWLVSPPTAERCPSLDTDERLL